MPNDNQKNPQQPQQPTQPQPQPNQPGSAPMPPKSPSPETVPATGDEAATTKQDHPSTKQDQRK